MRSFPRNAFLVVLLGSGSVLGWWFLHDHSPENISPAPTPGIPVATSLPAPHTSTSSISSNDSVNAARTAPQIAGAAPASDPSLLAQIDTALSKQTDADWEQVVNGLFPALVAQDRAAAVLLVEKFPPGDRRAQLLRRLIQLWVSSDFAGAVAWIATLPNFAEQKASFYDACLAEAGSNPAEAVHAWESFDFKDDDHVMENLVQNWAGKDLAAAQAWVNARPPSLQRDQAVARIAYVMAQTNPTAAAVYVTREIAPGPAQTEAAISILHQWAKVDLPGATAWVERFPSGPLAARAKSELAGINQYQTATPALR